MISYHDTVNDVPANHSWGNGPFARREWFAMLERAGARPLIALAFDGRDTVILPLMAAGRGLASLTNWYAFTWAPFGSFMVSEGPWVELAADLAGRTDRIEFTKVPDENGLASLLEQSFRTAGWLVQREACDVNHILNVNGRTFAQFLADRPGPLRTTLKRKAKKVEVRLTTQFDPADWAAYEAIYADSWKPEEGDPALLRAFAEAESAAGRFRFGLALDDGKPVAAQFWTVEDGTAYIHKLAHRESADRLSPGTTLTAALFERVIDIDKVALVDFGTGDDAYKRDWMEAVRTRWRLTCIRPGVPRNWPVLAKWMWRRLGG
jgi:CelD/BcsL family acetyltransferase involved in cellulose biosynthesis